MTTEKHAETECCSCGIMIAMTPEFLQRMRDSGDMFWCLNGHSQHFSKSTVNILREKITVKDREIARLEMEVRKLSLPKRRGRPSKK